MWMPAMTFHSIKMPGAVSMRTLYMRRGLASRLPATCTVFHITPLLRELIVETVRIKELRMRDRLHCALRDLLLSQLGTASPMPISLTLPHDRPARALSDLVMSDPGDRQSLAPMRESV